MCCVTWPRILPGHACRSTCRRNGDRSVAWRPNGASKSSVGRRGDQLVAPPWSLDDATVAALLDPAIQRFDSVEREPNEGVAIFVTACSTDLVIVPGNTPALVTVASEPDLLPLVAALAARTEFDLLVLSPDHVQLFRSNARALQPMARYDLPRSRDDAHWNEPHEADLDAPHPEASGRDERTNATWRFIEIVERRLPPAVREGRVPLVVAAVDDDAAVFRLVSSHPKLLTLTALGSPAGVSLARLHDAAADLVLELGCRIMRRVAPASPISPAPAAPPASRASSGRRWPQAGSTRCSSVITRRSLRPRCSRSSPAR